VSRSVMIYDEGQGSEVWRGDETGPDRARWRGNERGLRPICPELEHQAMSAAGDTWWFRPACALQGSMVLSEHHQVGTNSAPTLSQTTNNDDQ